MLSLEQDGEEMNATKYQDQILEAIDQLRRRKARPDAERIYSFLLRRHGVNYNDARTALHRSVENGAVLKVSYKGNISYRNAAKRFFRMKRDNQREIIPDANKQPSRKFTGLLTAAITQLVLEDPDYLEIGVPGEELIKNILSKDNVKYNKKYLSILLDKEIETGGLVRMENGHFLVGPAQSEQKKPPEHDDCIEISIKTEKSDGLTAAEIKVKKKPGPKPGLKREKSIENNSTDERKEDNGNLRVGGRRKVSLVTFLSSTLT